MGWAARYLDSEFGTSLVFRISIYEVTLEDFVFQHRTLLSPVKKRACR